MRELAELELEEDEGVNETRVKVQDPVQSPVQPQKEDPSRYYIKI